MNNYGQGGTRLWRRIRQQVLDRDRYECQARLSGCTFTATEVHHIVSIAAAGLLRSEAADADACQAICKACHDKLSAKQRAAGQAQANALRRHRLHPPQPHPGD